MDNQLKRDSRGNSKNLQWNEHSDGRGQQTHRGKGPKGYRRSDERIEEEVNKSLTDDPQLDATSITVSVQHGDVVLAGTVSTREDKRRAEDCIDDISGVNNIENRIKVDRNSDAMSRSEIDTRQSQEEKSKIKSTKHVTA